VPVFTGETPTKESTAQYTYTFDGWTTEGGDTVYTELPPVTADVSYYAHFAENTRSYNITWKVDGQDDVVTTVAYGEDPVYPGEPPVKPADDQYTYTFTGWSPEIVPVTGKAEYTAQFSSSVNTYTVTWVNGESEYAVTDVAYNANPEKPSGTPIKEEDAQYTYTFAGWNTLADGSGESYDEVRITEATTFYAVFNSSLKSYRITFVDDNNTEIGYSITYYGDTPEYTGTTPTKAADAQYTYTFAGWEPELAPVTGEATYKAKFDSVLNKYTVIWKNEDGTVLETDENVEYGTVPTYDGKTPTKAGVPNTAIHLQVGHRQSQRSQAMQSTQQHLRK
jgi:uncharacterized repeat protein (TIGR02543 family)